MLTLREIQEKIEACDSRLEELVDEITEAAGDAAVCETTFKTRFAQERLKVRAGGQKMTVDQVEDHATVATEDDRRSYLLATNNLTVLREALRATQARMDGLRTMAASFRGAGG